jgi:hypothetical protein
VLTKHAIGTTSSLAKELFESPWGYSKLVQQLYKNKTDPRTEAVLLSFGTESTDYILSDGTSIETTVLRTHDDIYIYQSTCHVPL